VGAERGRDQPFGRDAAGLLAALERPFLRSQSTAVWRSPRSRRALPAVHHAAPVASRSSFTICALIVAMIGYPVGFGRAGSQNPARSLTRSRRSKPLACATQPSTRRAANLLADLVDVGGVERGDLRIVKNTRSLSCFSSRARRRVSFLRSSATPAGRTRLEAAHRRFRRQILDDRPSRRAGVDPRVPCAREMPSIAALATRSQLKRDGAARVVVAGHHVGDALGIAVVSTTAATGRPSAALP